MTQLAGDATTPMVTVRQVHGAATHQVVPGAGPLQTSDGRAVLTGDGLLTAASGIVLGIQTADCVPVLVADTRLRVVAAFHAGWRGTVAAIVEQGIAQMQQEFGSRTEDLTAAIGPCIRSCCFAVGEDVRRQFAERFAYSAELFAERTTAEESQLFADLQTANRRQLLTAGVPATAIYVIAECTACTRIADGARRYFSHRAEHGVTGRMLSAIAIMPQ